MGLPAIPQNYYQHWKDDIKKAPPGHKFGPFFNIWDGNWNLPKEGKAQALKDICGLGRDGDELLSKLLDRQKRMTQLSNEDFISISGRSNSPFMTGVGIEHPLEIGFAFLNPYGIPYLPGASIKGVIRKAAEDLALGFYGDQTDGWSILDVWWLFGFESESAYLTGEAPVKVLKNKASDLKNTYLNYVQTVNQQKLNDLVVPFIKNMLFDEKLTNQYKEQPKLFLHELANTEDKNLRDGVRNRGALVFWDVFPRTSTMEVDILTPHYTDYYEGKTSPSDCGQPKPNAFLTVPPNSEFNFNIQCDTTSLPNVLKARWKVLTQTAFKFAFILVGFGAKTSVGYGRINLSTDSISTEQTHYESEYQQKPPDTELWENAVLTYAANTGAITATWEGRRATVKNKEIISDDLLEKLKKRRKTIFKNVKVAFIGGKEYILLEILE